jgi:AAA family ATP:ADP antiporter
MEDEKSTTLQQRLTQLFRVYPGEASLVLALGLLLFSNSVATQVSGVVAISGFLSEAGVEQMPIVWTVDMLVIMLATGLQSLIIDRFERLKLMRAMTLSFALAFVTLRLMVSFRAPGWLNYGLMFILSEQQWLFLPLVFWVLAQDVFSVAQAKRLFPLIAGLSFVGELVGLAVTAAAPQLLQQGGTASEELLLLNVLIYLFACLVVMLGLGKVKVRQTVQQRGTVREILTEGWDFVREVPAFRYLSIAILAINLCLTFLEFRFLVVTHQAFAANYQTFYALYRFSLILAAFLLQGFLTSRIIGWVTLKNSFLFMPFALLIGAASMLLQGMVSTVGGFVVPKITQYTVDESTRKAFQALVPEERRGRVSMFMESYLFALGTFAGSLVILAVLLVSASLGEMLSSYIYRSLAVLTALVVVGAVLLMRRVYERSMFDWRLKRRQRAVSVLDTAIIKALSDEESQDAASAASGCWTKSSR